MNKCNKNFAVTIILVTLYYIRSMYIEDNSLRYKHFSQTAFDTFIFFFSECLETCSPFDKDKERYERRKDVKKVIRNLLKKTRKRIMRMKFH